jgi:hypothetical protein
MSSRNEKTKSLIVLSLSHWTPYQTIICKWKTCDIDAKQENSTNDRKLTWYSMYLQQCSKSTMP